MLNDAKPVLGLLPYAPLPDFSAVLVHASALARHTQGLRPGAPFAILIHDRKHAAVLPWQPAAQITARSDPDWRRR